MLPNFFTNTALKIRHIGFLVMLKQWTTTITTLTPSAGYLIDTNERVEVAVRTVMHLRGQLMFTKVLPLSSSSSDLRWIR